MKIKGEPGKYIPYNEVVQLLTAPVYGAKHLVDLGLFHSEHFVRDAMEAGKMKFLKINKRTIVIAKDHVLEYWQKYRKEPYELANNVMPVRLTITDVDYVMALVKQGTDRVDREFSKDDLFRNALAFMRKSGVSVATHPQLFQKHF